MTPVATVDSQKAIAQSPLIRIARKPPTRLKVRRPMTLSAGSRWIRVMDSCPDAALL